MTAVELADIYERHIKALPREGRLQLVALIARELAEEEAPATDEPRHSILELRGLGKEIWEGVDGQEYVNRLRDEWDGRPS
jgi:hypothetical protein